MDIVFWLVLCVSMPLATCQSTFKHGGARGLSIFNLSKSQSFHPPPEHPARTQRYQRRVSLPPTTPTTIRHRPTKRPARVRKMKMRSLQTMWLKYLQKPANLHQKGRIFSARSFTTDSRDNPIKEAITLDAVIESQENVREQFDFPSPGSFEKPEQTVFEKLNQTSSELSSRENQTNSSFEIEGDPDIAIALRQVPQSGSPKGAPGNQAVQLEEYDYNSDFGDFFGMYGGGAVTENPLFTTTEFDLSQFYEDFDNGPGVEEPTTTVAPDEDFSGYDYNNFFAQETTTTTRRPGKPTVPTTTATTTITTRRPFTTESVFPTSSFLAPSAGPPPTVADNNVSFGSSAQQPIAANNQYSPQNIPQNGPQLSSSQDTQSSSYEATVNRPAMGSNFPVNNGYQNSNNQQNQQSPTWQNSGNFRSSQYQQSQPSINSHQNSQPMIQNYQQPKNYQQKQQFNTQTQSQSSNGYAPPQFNNVQNHNQRQPHPPQPLPQRYPPPQNHQIPPYTQPQQNQYNAQPPNRSNQLPQFQIQAQHPQYHQPQINQPRPSYQNSAPNPVPPPQPIYNPPPPQNYSPPAPRSPASSYSAPRPAHNFPPSSNYGRPSPANPSYNQGSSYSASKIPAPLIVKFDYPLRRDFVSYREHRQKQLFQSVVGPPTLPRGSSFVPRRRI